MKVKKLELQRETLMNLVGGFLPYENQTIRETIQDTVYSRSDCVPFSTRCPSADTRCTACIA